jgi:hypothetical protein
MRLKRLNRKKHTLKTDYKLEDFFSNIKDYLEGKNCKIKYTCSRADLERILNENEIQNITSDTSS